MAKDGLDITEQTSPPVKRRRQQQRSIETRARIVDAALSEFARFGFAGASTRGISVAADVPHSLVIHHFGTKDQLWHETVREAVSWYRDRVFDPVEDKGATERLRWYFVEYIRFSAHHPDFFRMMTQENTLRSERLAWLVETHVGTMVTRTIGMIEAAQAEGTFIDGDPMQLLYLFLGAATSPYRSAAEIMLLTGRSPDEPEQIEAHIRACERLFFREPSQSPKS